MKKIERIKNRIRAYRLFMKWTKVRLAENANLSSSTAIRDMDSDGWNPTAKTLEALDQVVPPRWMIRKRRVK